MIQGCGGLIIQLSYPLISLLNSLCYELWVDIHNVGYFSKKLYAYSIIPIVYVFAYLSIENLPFKISNANE